MRLSTKFAIVASNYGRTGGWVAEIDCQPVAELDDPEYDDMFWESYRIEGLGKFRDQVEEDEFWNRELVFRSKSLPEFTVTGCIARWRAGEGRLLVRSLYIHGVELNVFEKILFAIWRSLQEFRAAPGTYLGVVV